MKQFAYLFTVGGKIVISREPSIHLQDRMKREPENVREAVREFIEYSAPGEDFRVSTGEVIFCVADPD